MKQRSPRKVRRLGAGYERLESRQVLATFTVTTSVDVVDSNDNLLSLREAIQQANSNTDSANLVQFSSELTGAIQLTQGELAINRSLSIAGPTTIDAGNASRIFSTKSGISLSLQGLTLQNGRTAAGINGGAIFLKRGGQLSLQDVVFQKNVAGGSGGAIFGESSTMITIVGGQWLGNAAANHGGAIRAESSSRIVIDDSSFVSNVADSDATNGGDGGAIYGRGTIEVRNSSFRENLGRNGGAIYRISSNTTTLVDAVFTANSAQQGGGAVVSFYGRLDVSGGEMTGNRAGTEGGAMRFYTSSGTISNLLASGNVATTHGGAVSFYSSGMLTVTGGSYTNNGAGNESGAMHLRGNATIRGTTFQGNYARSSGGAITARGAVAVTIQDSSLTQNQVTFNGGAIRFLGSQLVMQNSTLTGNEGRTGGGVFHGSGTATFENVQFVGNQATQLGGALHNLATVSMLDSTLVDNKAASGAAINAGAGSRTEITRGTLPGNVATSNGGVVNAADATLIFTDSTVTGSRAVNGGFAYVLGGTLNLTDTSVWGSSSSGQGGAIYVSTSSTSVAPSLHITRGNLSQNKANGEGGAIYANKGSIILERAALVENESGVSGGAIWMTAATFGATWTDFHNNRAAGDGGAIRASSASLNLANNSFQENVAASRVDPTTGQTNNGRGGAINAFGGSFTVGGDAFLANQSAGDGGAIYIDRITGVVGVRNARFAANIAGDDGGAIASSNNSLLLDSSVYEGNSATANRGGALYLFRGTANISAVEFLANHCAEDGGAIFADGSTSGTMVVSIADSLFDGNTTGDDGGGIYSASNTLNISRSTFQNNQSGDDGGAFYLKPLVNATVSESSFVNNVASDVGGATFIRESSVEFLDSLFSGNTALHLFGTAPKDGSSGLLSYDSSAVRHASGRFTRTSMDGMWISEAALATDMDIAAVEAVLAQFPLLEDWLK